MPKLISFNNLEFKENNKDIIIESDDDEIEIQAEIIEEEKNEKTEKNSESNYEAKGRQFHIVINPKIVPKLEKIIDYLISHESFRYILVGQHKLEKDKHGDIKEPHYHIYVQYNTPTKLSAKRCYNCHIKTAWASAKANINYIKCKDGSERHKTCEYTKYYEEGFAKYKGGWISPEDIIERYKEDNNILLKLDSRFYNVYKRIIDDYLKKEDWKRWRNDRIKGKNSITVDYHCGPAGSGKTYSAAIEAPEDDGAVLTMTKEGEFALTIGDLEHCKTLILNEFRDSQMRLTTFLTMLLNEAPINIKGAQIYPHQLEKIIITSVQPPNQLYKNCGEDRNQIYRRIDNLYYHNIVENTTLEKGTTIEYKTVKVPLVSM